MFELDLSMREGAAPSSHETVAECADESPFHKRDRCSIQNDCILVPKRPRFEMENASDASADSAAAYRPGTPPELLALRAVIEDADLLEGTPVMPALPPPEPVRASLKERWRHAGLMSEYGGIREWLRMQRANHAGNR